MTAASLIDTYMLAQIIGLTGYGFYMAAPYFKKRHQILGVELAGCVILCLHWYFMDVPVMVWANMIWVYMIACSLLKPYTRHADMLIGFSFVFVVINAALHWQGNFVDIAAFMAVFLAVISRFYIDLFKFRSLAFASGVFSVAIGIGTGSISAMAFNIAFTYGHLRGMAQLKPGFFMLPIFNLNAPRFVPARIRSRTP